MTGREKVQQLKRSLVQKASNVAANLTWRLEAVEREVDELLGAVEDVEEAQGRALAAVLEEDRVRRPEAVEVVQRRVADLPPFIHLYLLCERCGGVQKGRGVQEPFAGCSHCDNDPEKLYFVGYYLIIPNEEENNDDSRGGSRDD